MQCLVQPALHHGFGDIQIIDDLSCRPAQVVSLKENDAIPPPLAFGAHRAQVCG